MEKVTILIPLYNVKFEWLVEALQSIKRQTYDCWEIILVNDGNSVQVTNDIHKIIYSDGALNRRAKIIDLDTNGGIANALNIGLAACETELVARLDADDRMHPQRLARQVAKMRCAPEISVLGGFALLIDTNGNFIKEKVNQLIYPIHHTAILNAFQSFCSIAHPAVMYRKEHVLKAGGYDCSAKYFEDYDLWIRMASMNFRFHNLPSMMIDYRIHDNSVSKVFEIEQAKGMRSCMDKATRMKFHKIEMA